MTRLEWTDPAIADLEHITDYISRDSPQYAVALVERLIISVEKIKSFPESGRRVPEASDPKVRELLVEGYRVIYRLRKGTAQVLAIVHGARNLAGTKLRPWARR